MKTLSGRSKSYPLWTVTWTPEAKKAVVHRPVLIAGLPGIGNVGKIVVDLLVENLGAKRLAQFFSYDLPHSVFVQESHLVSLPRIELYHARVGKRDFLFIAGDVQPMTERSSYQFCELVLDIHQALGGQEILTLGGIGLPEIPQAPRLYITGHDAKQVVAFAKGLPLHTGLYGVVGPIIGVSGLLVGLAARRRVPAFCILAETLGHQLHIGLLGARKTVGVLAKRYGFKIELSRLDKAIKKFEIQLRNESEIERMGKPRAGDDVNYIG